MQAELIYRLVSDLQALRQAVVGERIPPEAQQHFRSARREALLGVRAVVDHALARVEAEEAATADNTGSRMIPVEG